MLAFFELILFAVAIIILVPAAKAKGNNRNQPSRKIRTISCPNCGSPADLDGNQWVCPYCGDSGTW